MSTPSTRLGQFWPQRLGSQWAGIGPSGTSALYRFASACLAQVWSWV